MKPVSNLLRLLRSRLLRLIGGEHLSDLERRLARAGRALVLAQKENNAVRERYALWLDEREHYGERVKLADAVAEWLVFGPLGEKPESFGVHPFKRWDILPIPEDGEDYRAGIRHRGGRPSPDGNEGALPRCAGFE